MAAITQTHKAPNDAMARYWLQQNGFKCINGRWMDKQSKWARCEPMPSGKILIKVGVA